MKRTTFLWIIAFIITIFSAYYQRITGPTYPLSGTEVFQGKEISYKFYRSHSASKNCPVVQPLMDSSMRATLLYKRYKTDDELTQVPMKIFKDTIVTDGVSSKMQKGYFAYGEIPVQPQSGKVEYFIRLSKDQQEINIPEKNRPVVRFKGDVSALVLFPHIIFMFIAMLFATRAGLEYFNKTPNYKKLVYWTLGFLIVGGFLFGMLVQKAAFGEYWTGIPFGFDLTDNKTLIALICWIIAAVAMYRSKKPGLWVLAAAIIMLITFIIPHSVLGS